MKAGNITILNKKGQRDISIRLADNFWQIRKRDFLKHRK